MWTSSNDYIGFIIICTPPHIYHFLVCEKRICTLSSFQVRYTLTEFHFTMELLHLVSLTILPPSASTSSHIPSFHGWYPSPCFLLPVSVSSVVFILFAFFFQISCISEIFYSVSFSIPAFFYQTYYPRNLSTLSQISGLSSF